MLKITRKHNESIVIGDPCSDDCIIVTPIRHKGGEIKIGITAPAEMRITRTEHHRHIPATELSMPVIRHWSQTGEL